MTSFEPIPASLSAESVESVASVSVLADGLRRRLYGFIRRAHRPVTREEAAGDAGISAKLAAFHLDKLVAAGLLRARYDSPGGIRRVGRKPKVYELADTDIRISIPERRPDVLAEILMDAVLMEEPGEDAKSTALRTARRRGEGLGAAVRARTRPGRLGPERALALSEGVLEEHGYEPDRRTPTELRLLNCPFHPLATRSPELVCEINHAFLGGLLAGLKASSLDAVPARCPGQCCVQLRAASGGHSQPDHVADSTGICGKENGTSPVEDHHRSSTP